MIEMKRDTPKSCIWSKNIMRHGSHLGVRQSLERKGTLSNNH